MHSNIFSYLPKDDREFIEEWVRVRVEKAVMGYSRFDRFLTFVERGATGTKNVVSGTASWVVETISKIGFHILVANVAYFGLTYGAEWYNGKLIETMNENERLTEQIHEAGESYQEKVNYFSSERDAALKLLEEKQAELDSANKRVKAKKVAKPKAPAVSAANKEEEYSKCVTRKMSMRGYIDHTNAWACAACPSKNLEFKACWANKLDSGRGHGKHGESWTTRANNKYLRSKDAIDCWERSCQ